MFCYKEPGCTTTSTMLTSRGYNKNVIKRAIQRASLVKRDDALIKVKKVKKDRMVLAITHNPMLPSLSKIAQKHWRTMAKDKHSLEIFPQPPMIAYRQPPNLKQTLCRAKLPTAKRSQRQQHGMQRCLHQCPVCIHMLDTRVIKAKNNDTYQMNGQFGCETTSVIYLATCLKCKKQYVGQTLRRFYDRVMDHIRYVKAEKNALGEHLKNSKGCDSSRDLKFQVIERVYPNEDHMRLHRDKFWIDRLDTMEPNVFNRR